MRLPFGLDLKSIIVTVVFVYLVLPFVTGWLGGRGKMTNGNKATA